VFLEGKRALVTASSRNLGAEIVRALAAEGASVAVNYHGSREAANRLIDALPGRDRGLHAAVGGDATTPEGVDRVVGDAITALGGGIDVLVNNVGPFSMTPFAEMPLDEWRRIWDANVTSAYVATRAVVPHMRASGWGRIVNLSAGSAWRRNHSIYTLAKQAIITLTEALALELAPEIHVNAVAPGQIVESADDMAEFDPTFVERATAATPLGRLATRAEVAGIVVALCGPTFDMVTGVTIPVDGGWRLNRP